MEKPRTSRLGITKVLPEWGLLLLGFGILCVVSVLTILMCADSELAEVNFRSLRGLLRFFRAARVACRFAVLHVCRS